LGEALGGLGKPKRRKGKVTGPSGKVYEMEMSES
jgi:hypothetical protein